MGGNTFIGPLRADREREEEDGIDVYPAGVVRQGTCTDSDALHAGADVGAGVGAGAGAGAGASAGEADEQVEDDDTSGIQIARIQGQRRSAHVSGSSANINTGLASSSDDDSSLVDHLAGNDRDGANSSAVNPAAAGGATVDQ